MGGYARHTKKKGKMCYQKHFKAFILDMSTSNIMKL